MSTNDFGGGFDASDEATKVAAPPLADIGASTAVLPVPTAGQRSDGIGTRVATAGGVVFHPLGAWNPTTGTTDAAPVALGASNLVFSAGTQPVDIKAHP